MIFEFGDTVTKYMLDIGRPSFYNDDDCVFWQKIFSYIEETSIKIQVNGMYHSMRNYAFTNGRYLGGGYKFYFWFETKNDRKQFAKEFGKIAGEEIYDYRGVMFCRRQDKTYHLMVDRKYISEILEIEKHGIKLVKRIDMDVSQTDALTLHAPYKWDVSDPDGIVIMIPEHENKLLIIESNSVKILRKVQEILNEYFWELD